MELGLIVRGPHTNHLVAEFGCLKALGQMSDGVPDVVTVGVAGLVRLQLMQNANLSGRRPTKCSFGTSESNSSRDEHKGIRCMSGSMGPKGVQTVSAAAQTAASMAALTDIRNAFA